MYTAHFRKSFKISFGAKRLLTSSPGVNQLLNTFISAVASARCNGRPGDLSRFNGFGHAQGNKPLKRFLPSLAKFHRAEATVLIRILMRFNDLNCAAVSYSAFGRRQVLSTLERGIDGSKKASLDVTTDFRQGNDRQGNLDRFHFVAAHSHANSEICP